MRRKPLISVIGLLLLAGTATGQIGDEKVSFDRPEAWAMQYFTAAALMQGNHPPDALEKGQVALGFDVANIPHLSRAERTVGFNGTKEENLNKAPLLARPLFHYGLTDRVSLTASYVPPVEVFDRLETHLAGLFINYTALGRGKWSLKLRAGGQWSRAEGDFTCAEEIAGIDDPMINPFACAEPSSDVFSSLSGSIEAGLHYQLRPGPRPLGVFVNTAYTYADLEFDVDARWAGGFEDKRRLYTSGSLWSFGIGLEAAVTDRLQAAVSVVHVPLDIRRPPDFESENDSLTHLRLTLNLLL